ncbi:MAG TPA: hypothetical protein VGY58_24100 [Gemmataceae bacterium]|nr:hypothetical protein [Gemmataceae bacterium]
MKRNVAILVAGVAGSWLLVFYPARLLWGDKAPVLAAVAGLLCLIPALVTLVWSRWALRSTPEQQLLAVMGGTGLRMIFAAGAGIAMFLLSDYFHEPGFLIWVVVFYLVTLALEVSLVLGEYSAGKSSQNNG